jgi:hypothetical protein
MILVMVFALGGLISCWIWADMSARANLALTVTYAATWAILLAPPPYDSGFVLAQALFAIVACGLAFGIDWIMRDGYHWR